MANTDICFTWMPLVLAVINKRRQKPVQKKTFQWCAFKKSCSESLFSSLAGGYLHQCYLHHQSPSPALGQRILGKVCPLDTLAIRGQKPGTAAEHLIMSASAVGVTHAGDEGEKEGTQPHYWQQRSIQQDVHKNGKSTALQRTDWSVWHSKKWATSSPRLQPCPKTIPLSLKVCPLHPS